MGGHEGVEALVALGANVNVADDYGGTPLSNCVLYKQPHCQVLLAKYWHPRHLPESTGIVATRPLREMLYTTDLCLLRMGQSRDVRLCVLRWVMATTNLL